MAYTEKTYVSPLCIEHEIYYKGKYGAKGEKRAKRKKATPEQMERQNQTNRVNRLRRIIQLNFTAGDYWVTLKYPKGTRKPLREVLEDFKRFRDNLRRKYKKAGVTMKYIYRIEIGERGGIHIHILLPRIPDGDLIISEAWTRARSTTPLEDMIDDGRSPMDGLTDFTHIHPEGCFADLAEYICKDLPDERKEGLTPEERKKLLTFNRSRNMILPEPEVKHFSHWTLRRLLDMGVEEINTKPCRYRHEGYLVDKDSWVQGVNPYTGMSYLHYTEIPIRRRT